MVRQAGGSLGWQGGEPQGEAAQGQDRYCQGGKGNFGGKSEQIHLTHLLGLFIENAQEGGKFPLSNERGEREAGGVPHLIAEEETEMTSRVVY